LSFFNELKRRNVFKVGFAYIVMAWLVLQVADVILNNITAPDWVFRVILLMLGIGFLLALFFAWAYEMTPAGLKRESEVDRSESITAQTGKKLNNLILVFMALALGYFAYDKYVLSKDGEAAVAGDPRAPATNPPESQAVASPDKSIAVLPFVNMSADPEQEYFSDGIAEELLNRLAQFPDLKVAARTSAFQFKGRNLDVEDIGRQLNVGHVLEGSVRKGGSTLRITAQLIDSQTGFHMWSETYDRDASDVLKVQDDIAGAIATALHTRLGGSEAAQAGRSLPMTGPSPVTRSSARPGQGAPSPTCYGPCGTPRSATPSPSQTTRLNRPCCWIPTIRKRLWCEAWPHPSTSMQRRPGLTWTTRNHCRRAVSTLSTWMAIFTIGTGRWVKANVSNAWP